MITYHGASNQVALICQADAMHHRIFAIGTYYDGKLVEEWFMQRGELCTPCWEKTQAKRSTTTL